MAIDEVARTTYRLVETLGKVGKVQVGRALVALSLESGIEALLMPMSVCNRWVRATTKTYPSEANLVAKVVEGANALLRVADIAEFGKAKASKLSARFNMTSDENLPFASAGGGVDDGLALLDLTEARRVLVEKFVVGGRVKAPNVDIAVAMNSILQTLLNGLGVGRRREHGGDRIGNRGLLLEQLKEVLVNGLRGLGHHDLLGRRRGVARPEDCNSGRTAALRGTAKEGSGRGRLSGGVRAAAILQARNLAAAVGIGCDTARSIRHGMVRDGHRCEAALDRELSGQAERVCRLGSHSNVQRNRVALVGNRLLLGAAVGMMSLQLCHVRAGRNVGASGEGKGAELIHDGAHGVRVMTDVLAMRS